MRLKRITAWKSLRGHKLSLLQQRSLSLPLLAKNESFRALDCQPSQPAQFCLQRRRSQPSYCRRLADKWDRERTSPGQTANLGRPSKQTFWKQFSWQRNETEMRDGDTNPVSQQLSQPSQTIRLAENGETFITWQTLPPKSIRIHFNSCNKWKYILLADIILWWRFPKADAPGER